MTTAKDIASLILETVTDVSHQETCPVDASYARKEQVWMRTTDKQVFRVTVEKDQTVHPDDFDSE